jgi:hypothetical protein
MPIVRCTSDGKPGYRWGQSGTCYTYTPGSAPSQNDAKAKAQRQGVAARTSGYEAVEDPTAAQRANLPAAAYASAFLSDSDGGYDPDGVFLSSKSKLPHHINTVVDGHANKTVDVPRLRNALARFDQVDWAGFPDGEKVRARAHLEHHADSVLYSNEGVGSKRQRDLLRLDLGDFRNLRFDLIRMRPHDA